MNHTFRFKQFQVKHERAAMKVGTDSLLLGCFAEPANARHILDIGTGTGLLALMMAQKSAAVVDAVEIDKAAYHEARDNFHTSPWNVDLHIFHTPVHLFQPAIKYDLIICNPPYFIQGKSYAIQDAQRRVARHTGELSFFMLCDDVCRLLQRDGTFWLILPVAEAMEFKAIAGECGLHPRREIQIRPKESKPFSRCVICFGWGASTPVRETFTIYEEDGRATEEYFLLTKEFLLWENR